MHYLCHVLRILCVLLQEHTVMGIIDSSPRSIRTNFDEIDRIESTQTVIFRKLHLH